MRKIKKWNAVPKRLNVFFVLIFVAFTVLVFRLGVLQIVYGEDYKLEAARTEDVLIETNAPRGQIRDRNGEVIVTNTPQRAITYVRMKDSTNAKRYELAVKLAEIIHMPTDKIPERDKKDFWMFLNPERSDQLISEAEMAKLTENEATQSEIDTLKLERVTPAMLRELTAKDMQVL
ncbi:MAG: penicillin-binding protein, partial [Bacilli bacterium]